MFKKFFKIVKSFLYNHFIKNENDSIINRLIHISITLIPMTISAILYKKNIISKLLFSIIASLSFCDGITQIEVMFGVN